MTESEISSAPHAPAVAGPGLLGEPERQLRSLYLLFVATLMALVVLAVGIDFYLWYQVKLVRKELKATYGFLEEYQRNKEPLVKGLITGLQNLGQTQPDVARLLEKYGVKPSGINAAPNPASAPASAPPPGNPGSK